MPLSTATVTLNLRDFLGNTFDVRRTKVWLTTNAPKNTIHDTSTGQSRIGGGTVTLGPDGVATANVWAPGATANPKTWQTTVHVDYVDSGSRERKREAFGPYTITASGNLAALEQEQVAIPTATAADYAAQAEAAAGSVGDAATVATTAAAQAEVERVAAEAAAAQARDVSNIDTSDDAIDAALKLPGGKAKTTLAASIEAQVETTVGPLGSEIAAVRGPAQVAAGLRWAFVGDSITNGSNASNFGYAYMPTAIQSAGGFVARMDSIEAGTPGDTSAQLLARMDSIVSTRHPEAFVVFIGTNDANQAVPLATFAANLTAIIGKAKAAGAAVALATTPPQGSGRSAVIHQAVLAQNAWKRTFGPSFGCHVADVFSELVDPATGYLAAGYDSGDGLHPNGLGHARMSLPIAKAMQRARNLSAPVGLVRANAAASIGNMVADPLNLNGTTYFQGWFEWPGGTGTAPTYSKVADASGFLPAGSWTQMDFDATAAGGTRRLSTPALSATHWTAGDKLLLTAHVQIEDVTGTWVADAAAGTGQAVVQIVNQAGTALNPGGTVFARTPGVPQENGVYNIGPVLWPFTVPAGTTGLNVWFSLVLPTGKRVKMRVGDPGLMNLTRLGMADVFDWGYTPVNT